MSIQSILEAIGQTPILSLAEIVSQGSAEVYGKYEAGNPSYSVKDRIALAMVEGVQRQGTFKPGMTLVTATSGNTGVALGLVCAVKKIQLILFMPEDASLERRKMFEGFGAVLKITPKEDGLEGAMRRAKEYVDGHSGAFLLDQFNDPENPQAHERTTAVEILADFPDGVDALVVGVGTGGTLTGVGRLLKKKFPRIKIAAVEPRTSAVLSGGPAGVHHIQQLGHGFIPKNLDRSLIDRVVAVGDDDAYRMTRKLSERLGILVGISSGANVHASLQVARELGSSKKVLTFLCDAGQRYFSIEKSFRS